jgi:hypothetical protein
VKNAPAVTARRATNQIVLVADHQALAVTVAGTSAGTPAVTVAEMLAAIVLAEQTVRVATTPRIAPAAKATDHTRRVPPVMATGHIHRARLVTAIRDHVVMAHRLIDLVVMVRPARLARLVTAHTQLDPHAMETVHILLDPRVMEILGHRVPVASVPTVLVPRAMVIPVPVAMAMTAHVFLAATAIQAAGPHVVTGIRLVDRPAPGETAPILRGRHATVRVLIVHEVTVLIALVAIGLTVLARNGLIVHAQIVPMVTSRAASGSPMGESVVRSARR